MGETPCSLCVPNTKTAMTTPAMLHTWWGEEKFCRTWYFSHLGAHARWPTYQKALTLIVSINTNGWTQIFRIFGYIKHKNHPLENPVQKYRKGVHYAKLQFGHLHSTWNCAPHAWKWRFSQQPTLTTFLHTEMGQLRAYEHLLAALTMWNWNVVQWRQPN